MTQSKTAVTRTPRDSGGPVTIKPFELKASRSAQTTDYWVGVTRDAPFQNFGLGPITFPMYGEAVTVIDKGPNAGKVAGNPSRGQFQKLTEDQYETVVKLAALYFVKRYTPAKRGCVFFFAGSSIPIPSDADIEPIGHYLYMIPADGMGATDRDPRGEPPTMVPRS